jgi:hypothetical protein
MGAKRVGQQRVEHPEMAVALAITTGLLSRDTMPAEMLDHLAGPMRFYEEQQATS